eukprot:123450-Rhodomonas_salina.1
MAMPRSPGTDGTENVEVPLPTYEVPFPTSNYPALPYCVHIPAGYPTLPSRYPSYLAGYPALCSVPCSRPLLASTSCRLERQPPYSTVGLVSTRPIKEIAREDKESRREREKGRRRERRSRKIGGRREEGK